MATITVTTESYVEVPDDALDEYALAESVVKDALGSSDAIFQVKVKRTSVLLSK